MLVCVPKEEQKHTFSDSLLIPATPKLTPTQIIPPLPKRMKCSVCTGDETRHWVLAPQTSRLTVVTGSRAQIVQNMDYHGRGEQESRSEWRERTFWSRRPSVAGVSWDMQWGFRAGDGMHAERARRIRIQPGGRHRTQAEGGEDVAQVRGRGNAFSPRIELRSSPGPWESSGQSRQRAGIWRAGRCHVTRDDLSFGPGSVIYSPENSVNDFIVSFSSSINWNPALRDFHKKHTWHIIEPRNMFLKFLF